MTVISSDVSDSEEELSIKQLVDKRNFETSSNSSAIMKQRHESTLSPQGNGHVPQHTMSMSLSKMINNIIKTNNDDYDDEEIKISSLLAATKKVAPENVDVRDQAYYEEKFAKVPSESSKRKLEDSDKPKKLKSSSIKKAKVSTPEKSKKKKHEPSSSGKSEKKKSMLKDSTGKKVKNSKAKSKNGVNGGNLLKHGIPLTEKHVLVHSILKRWVYCLPPWPTEFAKNEADHEGLDSQEIIETGFQGIYAGYRGDQCGCIIDQRKKTKLMPTLNSLLKVDAGELKILLVEGLKKQKADLIKFKHLNTSEVFNHLCKELDNGLKDAEKINPERIEKDFAKKRYVA